MGSNPTPSAIFMNRTPNCQCSVCRKPIYRRPSQLDGRGVFCSKQCVGVGHRGPPKVCPVCKRQFWAPPKSGRKNCSRACSNKARAGVKYKIGSPADKAHIYVGLKVTLARLRGGVCERCQNRNFATLQVHHKIERAQGGTDDLDNLELLCPNCHTEHHYGFCLFEDYIEV